MYVLLLVLLIIFGCSSVDIDAIKKDVKSTDLSNENIDGILLGIPINAETFIEKYGVFTVHPDNDYFSSRRNYDQYWNHKLVLDIDRNNSEILMISVLEDNDESKSSKGIRVGNSITAFIEAYGENYFVYEDKEQTIYQIGYVDHENNLFLSFTLLDDKVTNIGFGYAFTNRRKWN